MDQMTPFLPPEALLNPRALKKSAKGAQGGNAQSVHPLPDLSTRRNTATLCRIQTPPPVQTSQAHAPDRHASLHQHSNRTNLFPIPDLRMDPVESNAPRQPPSRTSTRSLDTSRDRDDNISEASVESYAVSPGSSVIGFPTDGRHRHMIEDMYGVSERPTYPEPRKKMKLDKSQISRSFDPQSTDLEDYLKERKATNGYQNTASDTGVDTIDLTGDNDDDVVILDETNIEVCYGRVEGALVHAYKVPRPARSSIVLASSPYWPSIKCDIHRKPGANIQIELKDPYNTLFGILDHRVAGGLAPVLDSPIVPLRVQTRLDMRRKKPDEYPGQDTSDVYRVSINLYGPRKMAEGIGKHLSQKNVWLGAPTTFDAGYAVCNPHAEIRRAHAATANLNSNRYNVQSETRTVEEVNSAVTKLFDQLASARNLPEMDPPETLKTNLLPHQRQALWYMTQKESPRKFGSKEEENNSLWRRIRQPNGRFLYRDVISGVIMGEEPPQAYGGLLADMMGLGKTLSILSLVLSSFDKAEKWVEWQKSQSRSSRKNIKTTLLVSPLSAVGNWVEQVKEHVDPGALSLYVFHGPSRTQDARELAKHDLVITTYTTVLSEVSGKSAKRTGVSPLSKVSFFRIVLDEAHTIREQGAAQSQAIFSLEAERRWAVTGTPIQNRLEDLASVTRFLRLYPYDDKAKFSAFIVSPFKIENPNAIKRLRLLVDSFTLRRVKDLISLPPRHDQIIILKFTEEEKALHEFFRMQSNVMMNAIAGEGQERMSGRMYHVVLKAIMVLRQISAHGKELLDQRDRARFRGLSANEAIDLENEDECSALNASTMKAYEVLSLMKDSSAELCVKCNNFVRILSSEDGSDTKDTAAAFMLPCLDLLCADCFKTNYQTVFDSNAGQDRRLMCPYCHGSVPPSYTPLTPKGLEAYNESIQAERTNVKYAKSFGTYEGPHTKTKALISSLLADSVESEKHPEEPPIKSVIFSSWTSHLDLIEIALKDNNLDNFARLDGTMSLRQRNAALDTFREDPDVTILLATIGAGGVGLNLTAGSKVYIMEPQYNPAAVSQAVDRVHRLGQKREVTTVQFIMKESIEEKILELAKKKQKLADLSLNREKRPIRGERERREAQLERMKEYRSLFT